MVQIEIKLIYVIEVYIERKYLNAVVYKTVFKKLLMLLKYFHPTMYNKKKEF